MHHFAFFPPTGTIYSDIWSHYITLPEIAYGEDHLKKKKKKGVFSSGPICPLHFSSQSAALAQSVHFLITFAVQCIYSGLPIKISVFTMIPLSIKMRTYLNGLLRNCSPPFPLDILPSHHLSVRCIKSLHNFPLPVSSYPCSVSKPFHFTPHLPLSLSESLCHGWPASSLCRASPGSAQLARCGSAGQRQEAVPALLVQKGAHQADRPSVRSSSFLSPWLPRSQHTHMPAFSIYRCNTNACTPASADHRQIGLVRLGPS